MRFRLNSRASGCPEGERMNRSSSVIMIGGPDSGKTNYLGRLWGALGAEGAALRATQQQDDVRYVLYAYNCLLEGGFAPRTETNLDLEGSDCSIEVAWDRGGTTEHADLYVPDVSGELWKDAVRTNELEDTWLSRVRQSVGALLFVRIDSDDQVPSLDWVTAKQHLEVADGIRRRRDSHGRSAVRVSSVSGTLLGQGHERPQDTRGSPRRRMGHSRRGPCAARREGVH